MNMEKTSNDRAGFFVRHYRETDQEQVLRIWSKESVNSHCFIPSEYWEGHLETIRNKYLPDSETYVAEKNGQIVGFISLIGNYVGALFVDNDYQRQGIGKALLAFAHGRQGSLFVDVYKENTNALKFYQSYGFRERREKVEPETGHKLLTMCVGAKEKNTST
jgi:putative acetyltransferase